MVLGFNLYARLLQFEDHLCTEILLLVHRRDREVPLFVSRFITEVRTLVSPGIPYAFV